MPSANPPQIEQNLFLHQVSNQHRRTFPVSKIHISMTHSPEKKIIPRIVTHKAQTLSQPLVELPESSLPTLRTTPYAFNLLSSQPTQTGISSSPRVKNLPSSNPPPHSYYTKYVSQALLTPIPDNLNNLNRKPKVKTPNIPYSKNTPHATPPPMPAQPNP